VKEGEFSIEIIPGLSEFDLKSSITRIGQKYYNTGVLIELKTLVNIASIVSQIVYSEQSVAEFGEKLIRRNVERDTKTGLRRTEKYGVCQCVGAQHLEEQERNRRLSK
jgi:hypothetical protein